MQWIFVLCGCMFLLSLIATYQVWTVSLKAGQSTYKGGGALIPAGPLHPGGLHTWPMAAVDTWACIV
jgi:hypothetical protein